MSKDWLKGQRLESVDRTTLEKGGELSDRVIAASIDLVRKEYKHVKGLQDTVLRERTRVLLANNRLENACFQSLIDKRLIDSKHVFSILNEIENSHFKL